MELQKDNREMRAAYRESLIEMAEKDDKIVILEADLMAGSGTKPFAEKFPHRTFNIGVAESNMIGVAAGLAYCGKIPFCTTFACFAARRTYDQTFVSVAFSGLNVKITGTDPGIAAEINGGTHMPFEDIGLMRNIPNCLIVEPPDYNSVKILLPQIAAHNGISYIRLFRKNWYKIYDENEKLEIGKAQTLADGKDVTIIATGVEVAEAIKARQILNKDGISARLINMHTIKPVDVATIVKAAKETGAIVTAENHNIHNGLGSAVAETLVEHYPVAMQRVGVKEQFGEVGPIDFLMEKFHLTAQDIVAASKSVIARK